MMIEATLPWERLSELIALYQDTLAAAITLAVFLPMVSDMCGFFFVLSFAATIMPKLEGI